MLAGLLLLAACLVQDTPQLQVGPFDRVVLVEITAKDPRIEGRGGSRQVEYTSAFAGTLHAWVKAADGLDTLLRVEVDGKRSQEDDDSGGKPTPYLRLGVVPGSKLVFTLFAASPDGTGKVELHLCAAPETAATRAAVEHCKQEIAAIQQLRAAGDLDAVQARASALADHLAGVEGGAVSDDIADQVGSAAIETYALGLLRPTDRFRRHIVAYRERMLPPDHLDLLKTRSNLANTMRALGDPHGARILLQQVLDACTRTLPEEHPVTLGTLANLAIACNQVGDLTGARALQEKLVALRARLWPKDDEELLNARTNLASTLEESGDLTGALQIQEDVLAIRSRTLADDDGSLQDSRTNLANTLHMLGDLQRSRALKEKVLEVRLKTLPEQALDLQLAKVNLAATWIALGDLPPAAALLESALSSAAETLADDHQFIQMARHDLALVRRGLGDLKGARDLQERVLAAVTKSLPDDHHTVLMARHNLAATLLELGDAVGAHAQLERAFEQTGTLPEDHPIRLAVQEGMAAVLSSQGELAQAGALYDRVLEVRAGVLPDDHRDLQTARRNCAAHLAQECAEASMSGASGTAPCEARHRRFDTLTADLTRGLGRATQLAILTSSSRESEERCASLVQHLDAVLSLAAGYGVFPPDPELDRGAFLLAESMRGVALASADLARQARGSEGFAQMQADLRAASVEIARLAQAGGDLEAFRAAVARRDAAAQALVTMSRDLPSGGHTVGHLDLDAIVERLAPREALVAYRRYLRSAYEPRVADVTKTDSMCAFVLRRGGKLQRVELGALAPIQQAVKAWRALLGAPLERGLQVNAREDAAEGIRAAGQALRRLVFDPLLPAIDDSSRLIMLLDDDLHAVPIDALPFEPVASAGITAAEAGTPTNGAPQLLGERYAVLLRLSLHEIAPATRSRTEARTLLALGDVSYNSEPQAPDAGEHAVPEAGKGTPAAAVPPSPRSPWERSFSPLPYTGTEARGIAALAEEALGDPVRTVVLEKGQASRESVVRLAPNARWLHLATHGWFAPESIASWGSARSVDAPNSLATDGSGERTVRGLSPMLLCGLALAGANLPADAVGRYPGLITAEEIAGWDLANCELAVLSACETNVGDPRAGQGVASLQKALHMAGARTVITSLFKVSDEATKELMLDFYRRLWVQKKPKHQALWEAKLRLRDAKDGRGEPKYSPRDWAAWVLTGVPD